MGDVEYGSFEGDANANKPADANAKTVAEVKPVVKKVVKPVQGGSVPVTPSAAVVPAGIPEKVGFFSKMILFFKGLSRRTLLIIGAAVLSAIILILILFVFGSSDENTIVEPIDAVTVGISASIIRAYCDEGLIVVTAEVSENFPSNVSFKIVSGLGDFRITEQRSGTGAAVENFDLPIGPTFVEIATARIDILGIADNGDEVVLATRDCA